MKIVSGGQTGVDVAALDVARKLGMSWGGWAPRDWLREDGVIPNEYRWDGENGLIEDENVVSGNAHRAYVNRTRRNVEDSDFTLIYHYGILNGGTLLTRDICEELNKPHAVLDLCGTPWPGLYDLIATEDTTFIFHILKASSSKIVNVAGPRSSKQPSIYDLVVFTLHHALAPMFNPSTHINL